MKNIPIKPTRSLVIWALASLFFFYKYILQNFPSVMTHELMDAFHVEAFGLGFLSSAYFWTYLLVPLFAGILLDTYGVRWMSSFAIALAALGLIIFYQTSNIQGAILGRILMGIGASFATLTYFKIASVWFSPKAYSGLTAVLVSIGMLGAVCGQAPLAWFIHSYGWQKSLMSLSIFGWILAILFLSFVRDKSPQLSAEEKKADLKADILKIFKKKQNWLLTAYAGLAFAPVVIFCGLWGNPFLQTCHHLDSLRAPALISLVFVGLGIGSPFLSLFESRIQNRIIVMIYSTLISALCMIAIIFIHPLPQWILGILLFGFGFCLGAFPWVFVIGKELNPLYLAGTVISMLNASDALLDAITEPLIGHILDLFSSSTLGYELGLLILPLYQLLGVFCLIKVEK